MTPKTLSVKDLATALAENTILETGSASVISQAQLMAQLNDVQVVYAGESHTNPTHHAIQLAIIKAMAQHTPDLAIGMEMFAYTYQA
ncbi:MAG: ChaN family lipoprotein, partial [Desulfosarcina sp.]